MAVSKTVVTNVLGTSGNDTLRSTGLVEVINGGDGVDTLSFDEGTRGININLKSGALTDSFGSKDKVAGIEIVIGTSFNDVMTGSDGTDVLVGGGGNDTINGGAGNDELYGAEGNDSVNGGAGNDVMYGGSGNDTINGGAGFDTASYANEDGAGVTVNLTTGVAKDNYGDTDKLISIERVVGSGFADSITGNSSANALEGGGGDDVIDGGAGNDVLLGGWGDDQLQGGTGNDTLVGGGGNDLIDGGAGTDTLDYSQDGGWRGISASLATGFVEDSWGRLDTVKAVENIIGTGFDDWIWGNKGNNVITGGAGNDTLTGAGGNDTFVFDVGHGNDTIRDFNAGDKLDLSALGFKSIADVQAAAVGHNLGVQINTGAGSSIVLVDVNITSIATLGYIFA